MQLRETRSLHVHVGKDLYPAIGNYLRSAVASRIDSVRKMAVSQRILVQAEVEVKEYIEGLLKYINRTDIDVIVANEKTNTSIKVVTDRNKFIQFQPAAIEAIPFGFFLPNF